MQVNKPGAWKNAGYEISGGGLLILDTKNHDQVYISAGTTTLAAFGDGGGTLDFKNGNYFLDGVSPTITTTRGSAGNVNESFIKGGAGINLNGQRITFEIAEYSELTCTSRFWNGNNGLAFTGAGTFNLVSNFERAVGLTSNISRLNIQDGVTHVVGPLTVNSGEFSPGSATGAFGTATIDGAFTVSNGGTLVLEVGSDAHDLLVLNPLMTNTFQAGSIQLDILSVPNTEDFFEILAGLDASKSEVMSWLAAVSLEGFMLNYDYYNSVASPGSQGLWLSITAANDDDGNDVPEPATWGMLLLGGIAVLGGVRRRR